ncbi:MAG: hypothetical protein HY909_16340 [Deltaproteobacteria bacterium]|nr:hypothetical protein [Deltaproteobacteria bacterium]
MSATAEPISGYEFSDRENKVLRATSTWTLVLALIHLLRAASMLVGPGATGGTLLGVIHAVVAVLLFFMTRSFSSILTTRGNDIAHLMEVLRMFGIMLLIRLVMLGILTCVIAAILVLVVFH